MKFADLKFFALLALFQAAIFYWHFQREVVWDIPVNSDQASYLARSYEFRYEWDQHGWDGFRHAANELITQSPNGFGIQIEGAFLSLLHIGVRFPRMLVNLIALLAMEFIAFNTAAWLTSNRLWGWALIALLMAQNVAWFWAGGLFDFRPDFAAYCLYGIWTCLVLRSDVFLSRRWSLATAAAAVILILNRYVATVYVGGVVISIGVVLCGLWVANRKSEEDRVLLRQRLINFTIATTIIAAGTAPFLWLSWNAIYNYYVVGHLLGPEKMIRMHQSGIHNWFGFLMFYPRSILGDQLQKPFLDACIIILGIAALTRWIFFDPIEPSPRKSVMTILRQRLQFTFIVLAMLIPLGALTADFSKSSVVGGIVCVPVAVAIIFLAARICGPFKFRQKFVVMAIGIFAASLIGFAKEWTNATTHAGDYVFRRDIAELITAARWVSQSSDRNAWNHPRLSFDVVSPYICTNVLTCTAYESGRPPIEYQSMLGGSIFAIDHDAAFSDVANSDFVFLTTTPKKGPYPFYDSMKELEPDVDAWVQSHYTKGREFDFKGDHVTIYVRPTAQ